MNINELIDKIGGRERLEFLSEYRPNVVKGKVTFREVKLMARALLSVLDAKPVGEAITPSLASINNLELGTKIYTALPAASAPDGWKLVPVEPTAKMMVAGTLVSEFQEDPAGMYRSMIAAAPVPGGDGG